MTIIDPKYRGKYKDAKDWLSRFLDEFATDAKTRTKIVKVEGQPDETVTEPTGKAKTSLPKLFAIAEANSIKATDLYGAQTERPGAPGRLRMTLGNSLRAAARKRGGLNDADGNWHEAEEDFMAGYTVSENPDGSKIAKPAAEKAEAETAEA